MEFEEKLRKVEKAIAAEKGPFEFFALVLRERGIGQWDVVVCAPWIEQDRREGLKRIVEELKRQLTEPEFLRISRIFPIDETDPGLRDIRKAVAVEHGLQRYQEDEFLGQEIRKAWIITSRAAA